MPVLKNPKYERFAQALAEGKVQIEAYEEAGFKPHRGNASKLAQDKSIAARVAELLSKRQEKEEQATEKAIEALALSKENVLAELMKIGFSNMQDYVRVNDDGLPYVDLSAITRDQFAAVQEFTVDTTPAKLSDDGRQIAPEVTKVRFKLADKRGALVDLGRHLNLFPNRMEHTGKDGDTIKIDADVGPRDMAKALLGILSRTDQAASEED